MQESSTPVEIGVEEGVESSIEEVREVESISELTAKLFAEVEDWEQKQQVIEQSVNEINRIRGVLKGMGIDIALAKFDEIQVAGATPVMRSVAPTPPMNDDVVMPGRMPQPGQGAVMTPTVETQVQQPIDERSAEQIRDESLFMGSVEEQMHEEQQFSNKLEGSMLRAMNIGFGEANAIAEGAKGDQTVFTRGISGG